MDLQTVKEDLIGGNYESPVEFAKDMKLIFTNSRNYNTNKRSQVSRQKWKISKFLWIVSFSRMYFDFFLGRTDLLDDDKTVSDVWGAYAENNIDLENCKTTNRKCQGKGKGQSKKKSQNATNEWSWWVTFAVFFSFTTENQMKFGKKKNRLFLFFIYFLNPNFCRWFRTVEG